MYDYRGLIVIFLVIFAIIVTLFLLVEGVYIPPGQFSPFTDGTRIRIRSLLNNQYLVRFGDIDPNTPPINKDTMIFGAPKNNVNNVWKLCQNQGIGLGGSYTIYQDNSDTLGIVLPPITNPFGSRHIRVNNINTCDHNKGVVPPKIGSRTRGSNPWVQFRLIEKSGSPSFGGTVSNAYQILSSDRFWIITSDVQNPLGLGSSYYGVTIKNTPDNSADQRLETAMIIEVVST